MPIRETYSDAPAGPPCRHRKEDSVATRFARLGWLGRTTAVAALGILLIASSTSSAEPPTPPDGDGQAVASPSAAASEDLIGPIVSVTTPVPADPGYAAQVVAAGLDEVTAEFMAQTLSTVEVIDAHNYVVHHAFPNGATSDVTYHLTRAGDMSPGDPLEYTSEVVGDEYRYTLRYAIDVADVPPDLQAQLLEGLPTATLASAGPTSGEFRLLDLAPIRPVRGILTSDSPSTVDVVANGVISEGKGQVVDAWVEKVDAPGASEAYTAFKADKKVWEAVRARDFFEAAQAKLKALRKCAEDPTDPGTRKKYSESPQEKQSVLDELTQLENDMRSSIMVTFGSMLTDTGSSLVKAAPWLGFVVSPANDYVKATNEALVRSYLDQAEKRVVPCERSFKIKGSVPSKPGRISLTGKACSLKKSFKAKTGGDLVGTVEFHPTSDAGGTWDYQGTVQTVHFGVDGSGKYEVTLSDDGSSGTLHFVFVLTIHRPVGGSTTTGGSAHLTLTEVPRCAQ